MYEYQIKVRLHHTDAAGVIFFSNLLLFAHECYESFIEQTKSFALFLEECQYLVPIVHAEADYLLPIGPSQTLDVKMTLGKIGTTSFEIDYKFFNEDKLVYFDKIFKPRSEHRSLSFYSSALGTAQSI